MADSRHRLFFIYCHNRIDPKDDVVLKVMSSTKYKALQLVKGKYSCKYRLGRVMTLKGLKRFEPEWHALLWGVPPDIVDENAK